MNKYCKESTCCFTGHRPEKLPWGLNESAEDCRRVKILIADLLQELYRSGYRHFICGLAAGADMYFGEAVVALRDEHPDVTLEAAVPYEGQDRRWPASLRERYFRLSLECDTVTVLRKEYAPGCMMARNRYMVDRSSQLLALYDGRPGGTYNTIVYAAQCGLTIVRLPLSDLSGPF